MSCPTMHAWAGTYGARSNHDPSVGAFISARVLAMKKQGASGPLGPASHMNASASPPFSAPCYQGTTPLVKGIQDEFQASMSSSIEKRFILVHGSAIGESLCPPYVP